MTSVKDIEVRTADGASRTLGDYGSDVLLLVNVASKCGFTPQYDGLEKLNQLYRERGLRILGFPCNDFGAQEPGTLEEIREFCSLNYGVSFEIMDKVHCIGDEQHPLYNYLTAHAEPEGPVQWNFEKFLINRDGTIAGRFNSKAAPESDELIQAIEAALEK